MRAQDKEGGQQQQTTRQIQKFTLLTLRKPSYLGGYIACNGWPIKTKDSARKKMNKNKEENAIKFIISVLIAGYLIGTMTHVFHLIDVIKLGFHNSAKVYGVPTIVNTYWLTLTVIDPVIAILLMKKAKLGALLAFVNILINVIVNSSLEISRLHSISLSTIYNALGNIYNGLQIALFAFSFLSLPIIIFKKTKYDNYFGLFPFILLIIGLIIHLSGLIKLFYKYETLWILYVHISMIAIDGTLLYLLLKKFRIGYILALILFSSFGILQLSFAIAIFIGIQCSFNLAMAMTISMCCLVIASLILKREDYSNQIDFLKKV